MTAILKVVNLIIHPEHQEGSTRAVVNGVTFEVMPGEILGLIGESGSGKSTIGLAALGYVRPGLHITAGDIRLSGSPILDLDTKAKRKLRGTEAAYVPQSAAAAFNPALTINRQVVEGQILHGIAGKSQALRTAVDFYKQLGLPDTRAIGLRYPHEVSGGQLQRLAAAMAFAGGPKLVVFDEPTTALDVTTQIGVLHAFRETLRVSQAAAIYITHDLAVVAQLADRLIVLANGEIVEEGPTTEILTRPRHHLTKGLVAASDVSASLKQSVVKTVDTPLLSLRNVAATYQRKSRPIIGNVNLEIGRGEIVAVVGESGSGKSTLARTIAGLIPQVEGGISWRGNPLNVGVSARSRETLRQIQLVMQSADTALNPKQLVKDILARPLRLFDVSSSKDCHKRTESLLERVRLPPHLLNRLSSELSGGQKQRLNLARALAAEPDLVLCDEVTSALDVVTRAEIVDLIRSIRDVSSTSFLFITHDLITAAGLADRIVVMRNGGIVEEGLASDVMSRPSEGYTRSLINSIPLPNKGWLDQAVLVQNQALLLQ